MHLLLAVTTPIATVAPDKSRNCIIRVKYKA